MRLIFTKYKIITFLRLLKNGEVKKVGYLIWVHLYRILYKIRAMFEDLRLGGVSLERTIPSQFAECGSKPTQSTDYRILDNVFKAYPLKSEDYFVDVGCGEGRVLSYLYLRGFRNKIVGVEIDPDVAQTAKSRTMKCKNIEVFCANVLDNPDLIKSATAIFIFNPFNEQILVPFIKMIETHCDHNVMLYYLCDIHRKCWNLRAKWEILCRDHVIIPGNSPFYYSIYMYSPDIDC